MFRRYLAQWDLVADGDPMVTHGSDLLPVRRRGTPAMLKVLRTPEEQVGSRLMTWWEGRGAAWVLAQEEGAILVERAMGAGSLSDLARSGGDDEATQTICRVVEELHAPRGRPPSKDIPLVSLTEWFRELGPAAVVHGGVLSFASAVAQELLATPQEERVLHGDIHHGNILDFGKRGWLAIDPKGLLGERGFDYANLFCNPDLADLSRPVAVYPPVFLRRLELVCDLAKLERRRLLQWIVAGAGLSAAWFLADGVWPETNLKIVELAKAELAR